MHEFDEEWFLRVNEIKRLYLNTTSRNGNAFEITRPDELHPTPTACAGVRVQLPCLVGNPSSKSKFTLLVSYELRAIRLCFLTLRQRILQFVTSLVAPRKLSISVS